MMFNPYADISTESPLCQGDIVVSYSANGANLMQAGMIVTADCDLDKSKHDGIISLINIMPVEEYLNKSWAAEQLKKIKFTSLSKLNDLIQESPAIKSGSYSNLSLEATLSWMETHSIEEIVDSVGITNSSREDCLKFADQYTRSANGLSSSNALLALKGIWECQGRSIKDQRGQINQIFHHSKGKADIMFIPEIPTLGSIGFVVKLRDIFSIEEGQVYRDRLMVSDIEPGGGFFRIGRFVDGLKYAIVQRMAMLFSRIGLDEHFESEISTGYEIVSEHLFRDVRSV